MLLAWAVTVIAAAAVFVIAGSATLLPANCDTCHLVGDMRVDTQTAAHASVPCADCHVGTDVVSRITYGFRDAGHSTAIFGLRDRGAAAVRDERCLGCHAGVLLAPVSARGINIEHASCAAESVCTDCHSTTAHGDSVRWPRLYSMEQCLQCHGTTIDISECDTCHAGRRPRDRTSGGTWAVTHGPEWRSTHGMGDSVTCGACHPTDFCGRCHGAGLPHGGSFLSQHAGFAQDADARCESCHQRAFCDDCHGMEMPHPVAFVAGHAALVDRDGEAECRRCHDERDCTRCHELHVHPGGSIGLLDAGQAGGVR